MKIEKNIPPPKPRAGYNKYPFRDMEPGDSFAVPLYDGDLDMRQRLQGATCQHARRYNWKMTVRTVTENGQTLVRVWRLT